MNRRNHIILENGIYLLIWLIVFIIPLFGFRDEGSIEWQDVRRFWINLLPFLILFLVNNYVLIPFLLQKKKYISYFVIVLLLIGLLFPGMFIIRGQFIPEPSPFHGQIPPKREMERRPPQNGFHPGADNSFPDEMKPPKRLLPFKWNWIFNSAILSGFIIGLNIAIRLLFKSIEDEQRMKELESHSLKAELNYLKAQINPHFFMNTLNNIHALIDMDKEKAKKTVIELSKIMRYVLYDGDTPLVPLKKEIQFINNYIALMRIRYTDDVDIQTLYPEDIPDTMIPPLLLIVLIENAFKHGVSYRQPSFIYTELSLEDNRIRYHIRNSVANDHFLKPGMGLENLEKRLSLLYDKNYSLTALSASGEYTATLIIPVDI